nr:hypothetical protein [Tanacetum cinerariifolium]
MIPVLPFISSSVSSSNSDATVTEYSGTTFDATDTEEQGVPGAPLAPDELPVLGA